MRNIKKLAAALQSLSVVLLLVALVATIYNLSTVGTAWGPLQKKMTSVGADAGLITRGRFDAAYNAALSAAAATRGDNSGTRTQAVAKEMTYFLNSGTAAESNLKQVNLEKEYAFFNTEFDAAAYAESYASRANPKEAKELTEIYEYLDSLAAPKTGKKLPGLKLADNRPAFEEIHAAWALEYGEDAVGSFYEFSKTVKLMVEEAVSNGAAVTDAAAYFNTEVTFEGYQVKLGEVLSSEAVEDANSFLDDFVALCEQKANGEEVNFVSFFESQYTVLQSKYPSQTLPEYALFVPTAHTLIDSGIAFDGSYTSLYNALIKAQETASANSFSRYMSGTFYPAVIETADQSPLAFFQYLWKTCSLYYLFYLLAVVLVILSKVLDWALSRALVMRQARKHVPDENDVLLRVNHLKQYFRSGDFVNKAVDDISFYVKKGEVFGLVGESGCGKTTTGRTIINLYDPTEGDVYFQGLRISSNQNGLPVLIKQLTNEHEQAVAKLKKRMEAQIKENPAEAKEYRKEYKAAVKSLKAQLADRIEQAQMSALESSVEKERCVKAYRDKRKAELTAEYEKEIASLTGQAAIDRTERYKMDMKVAAQDNIMTKMQMIFQDPIASINPRMTVREIIAEGLIIRGIKDKKYIDQKVYEMLELVGLVSEHADRYPHEFSGGQRQRIGIARAIVMQPDLIIADEPISALDVSIQAQVINLLNDLRNKMGLTIMFIAHNLSVVKYFSDRIAVMYFGKIVEMTTSDELFEHPLHPYTKSLLSAIPYPDPHYEKQRKRIEYRPELVHDYSTDKPTLREITPGHFIYCNEAEFEAYKKELGI